MLAVSRSFRPIPRGTERQVGGAPFDGLPWCTGRFAGRLFFFSRDCEKKEATSTKASGVPVNGSPCRAKDLQKRPVTMGPRGGRGRASEFVCSDLPSRSRSLLGYRHSRTGPAGTLVAHLAHTQRYSRGHSTMHEVELSLVEVSVSERRLVVKRLPDRADQLVTGQRAGQRARRRAPRASSRTCSFSGGPRRSPGAHIR